MTERLEHIPTRPGMGRSIVWHDERSKNYRAVDLIRGAVAATKPRDRTWRRGQAYDQGNTSMCVAYTGKGLLNTKPISSQVDYDTRSEYDVEAFYAGAQEMDEWPGIDYDGTSALGLCKYLVSRALIQEYRWCFSLNDILLTLSHVGPVGLGIWWYTDMFYPNAEGLITPTGVREGGHEVELIGVDISEKVVIGMNSWGEDWGYNGRFKLRWEDLEKLLNEQGDAITILH